MLSIEVNGNNYAFSWGTLAIQYTCDKLSCELADLDLGIMTNKPKYLNTLAYCALVANDENENDGKNVVNSSLKDFSYAKFCNWLDNADPIMGKNIVDSYMGSKYLGKTMQEHYDDLIQRLDAFNEEAKETEVKKKTVRLAK